MKEYSVMRRAVRLARTDLAPALRIGTGMAVAAAIAAGGAALQAQGRGGGNWSTASSDAQRTAWVRTDARISKDTMQKPGFQLLWKVALDNQPRQLYGLTQPLLLQNIISYKGFKALAFVGGSGDNVTRSTTTSIARSGRRTCRAASPRQARLPALPP